MSATSDEIGEEVRDLETVERVVASSTEDLTWKQVAERTNMPHDRVRQVLATLRRQERVSVYIIDGVPLNGPGPKCRAERAKRPVAPPVTVRRNVVSIPEAGVTLPYRGPMAEPPAPITPDTPLFIEPREEPKSSPPERRMGNRSMGAANGKRDGTAACLLAKLDEVEHPMSTRELSQATGIPTEKCGNSLRQLAACERIKKEGRGPSTVWHRTSRPYPDQAMPKPAETEAATATDFADVAHDFITKSVAEHSAAATSAVQPEERCAATRLPVLTAPDVTAAITADGEIVVLEDRNRYLLARRHVRAIVRLVRTLDAEGLLDG